MDRHIRLLMVVIVAAVVSLAFETYRIGTFRHSMVTFLTQERQPMAKKKRMSVSMSMIVKPLPTATIAAKVILEDDSSEETRRTRIIDDHLDAQLLQLRVKQQQQEAPATVVVGQQHLDNDNDEDWLIGMISMGKVARDDYYAERCVRSIRVRGNYHGYILIVTDAYGKQKYDQTFLSDDKVVVLQARDEDLKPSVTTITNNNHTKKELIPYKDGKMKFKRFKTLLWDYSEQDERLTATKHLLYIDIDIVIGNDLHPFFDWYQTSLTYFIESTLDNNNNNNANSFISMFRDNKNQTIRHGGLLVFDRNYSSGCLNAWRSRMDDDGHIIDRDQKLFMQVVTNPKRYHCIDHELKRKYILFPTVHDMEERQYHTFVHATRTGSARKIDTVTQEGYFHDALLLQEGELLFGTMTWEEALRVSSTNQINQKEVVIHKKLKPKRKKGKQRTSS
jgi:hypothetical protein